MLYDKLALVGKACLATIAEIRRDKIYIEVQGFSKWGTLQVDDPGVSFELGAPLVVTLVGFSLEQMRFVFKEQSDMFYV
jgi:hypothetical protein